LGIAYLLQADPLGALEIFEAVTRLDPKYADGWVNVARARIANADFDGARVALDAARRVRPGFLKARYFDGEIAMREARFAEAEAAFLDVLASWPRERMALRLLARALYEQDRCDEALGVLDRLFALDPEDARGWFEATRALRRLGRRKEAKEAEARFNAYREDDDEPVRRGRALLERPDLQRLAQPIHVHTAPSVAR
ncbi:MAG: tetratricopeptide repeat protein, partial [Planctomycetota bacterium]